MRYLLHRLFLSEESLIPAKRTYVQKSPKGIAYLSLIGTLCLLVPNGEVIKLAITFNSPFGLLKREKTTTNLLKENQSGRIP